MYWNNFERSVQIIRCAVFSVKIKSLKALSFIMLSSIFSGCASIPLPKTEAIHIDRFQAYKLADGTKIFPASIDQTIPDVNILAINDDIKSLLEVRVKRIRDLNERLQMLANILVEKIHYDTGEDSYGVKTAQETFDTGSGNCLSFTNLIVAMARYSGFMARFSEIPSLPNWIRDGDVLFFTGHIGASVDIRNSATHVIQLELSNENNKLITLDSSIRYYFNPSALTPEYSRVSTFGLTAITDNRAFAQYYNNLGSKKLAEGNAPEAFQYFIKSIKTDPKLSFAWSNLGVIYRRNNQFDAAEAAYLQGLAVTQGSKDTSIMTIMNNLAYLYDMTGEKEKAETYNVHVASLREKNPYYQYAIGKTAYDESFYERSIVLFKKAIRLKDDEHLFYYGLALAYMKTGEIKKAKKNISRAIDHSWDERRKVYYERILHTIKNTN